MAPIPRLRVEVDPDRVVGTVSRDVFGHFIEHLGRCVYGGLFEPGSPLADARGFRTDVLEAMRRIGVPNLRWPGGNFASAYHWEDGVGPRDRRPARFDLAWRAVEPNLFGTAEYMEYCAAVGAAPYVCVNTGSGTLDEAARWVEYCNLPADCYPTYHASLRARHGHPAPYNVGLWGLGNEVYGAWQVGHAGAEGYARKAREFAYFMRAVDPDLRLVAVGADLPEWDETVLKVAGDVVDFISIHQYHGQEDYRATVGAAAYTERRLHLLGETIDRATRDIPRQRPVEIAMDEWNICYAAWGTGEVQPLPVAGEYFDLYEQTFALKDGLFAAGVFHAMFRECRHVTLANLAQMVNANGMLATSETALLLTPVYHAFDLYANHSGPVVLGTRVTARDGAVPSFTAEDRREPGPPYVGLRSPYVRFTLRDLPLLDAQATRSADGRTLYLAVINYDPQQAHAATLDLRAVAAPGGVWSYELNGPDTGTPASFEHPDVASVKGEPLPAVPESYTFPPHSATVLEIPLTL